MKNDLLLYIGAGVLVGSAVLGAAVGLAYVLRAKTQEFRYGVFYSVFALVASIGYCLASIAFYFNFLGPKLQIPLFCSLIALAFLAGLVVLALYVRKDSRVLFGVLSLYLIRGLAFPRHLEHDLPAFCDAAGTKAQPGAATNAGFGPGS